MKREDLDLIISWTIVFLFLWFIFWNRSQSARLIQLERGREVLARIEARMPDNMQKLATTCYVDSKLATTDGYFFDGEEKIDGNIVDRRKGDVQVSWHNYPDSRLWRTTRFRWISSKKFHRYYTLKEIAEILNKTK